MQSRQSACGNNILQGQFLQSSSLCKNDARMRMKTHAPLIEPRQADHVDLACEVFVEVWDKKPDLIESD